jgi:pSer/pThr/pTyr-binding forkhead associated (FHA) protein
MPPPLPMLSGVKPPADMFGPTDYAPAPPLPPPPAAQQYPSAAPQQYPPAPWPDQATRRVLAGFLVSYQDDPSGKFWPLWKGKNLIGRAKTEQKVDIEIADGTTSTHHASVEVDQGRFVLSDLGSTNGTFHNEEAIGFQGRRDLRDGDKIRFGGFSVIIIVIAARA